MIGVQLSSELFAQWGTYFYSPSVDTGRTVYVSIGVVAFIFMAGRVFDIVTDPLIAVFSDRASQRPGRWRLVPIRGRRRPFIFWGSVLMTVTGILFWYPPVAGESTTNFVYATILMSVHWALYTLAYIPLLALAPEIARTQQDRVYLGTWIGVGMIAGLLMAAVLPGELITQLDPARTAVDGEVRYSAVGYQRVAIIFSLMSLFCFQWFVWVVKERPVPFEAIEGRPIYSEFMQSFRVPLFRIYLVIFFLFYIGLLSNQRAVPFWVELGLGGDEGTVSLLGIPFAIACLVAALACPWLTRWFSVKWLMVFALATMALGLPFMYVAATLDAPFKTKFAWGAVIYGFKGIGLGMMYVLVTPLIGEIIDEAERMFGKRREAVFNAMHAVMVKSAQVLGIFVAVKTMESFGNSASQPLGVFLVAPVSSVFCIVAMIVAMGYPGAKRHEIRSFHE